MKAVGAASPVAASPHSFLAFDYGARRVGVAVGNDLLRRAQLAQGAADVDAASAALILEQFFRQREGGA